MKSVQTPIPGLAEAQLLDDAQEPLSRVAAVHQLQDAIAAALHGDVGALGQPGEPGVGFDEVVAIAFRVRRGETDALEAFEGIDGFEQVHKRRFAVPGGNEARP